MGNPAGGRADARGRGCGIGTSLVEGGSAYDCDRQCLRRSTLLERSAEFEPVEGLTVSHAATKSCTDFSCTSHDARTRRKLAGYECEPRTRSTAVAIQLSCAVRRSRRSWRFSPAGAARAHLGGFTKESMVRSRDERARTRPFPTATRSSLSPTSARQCSQLTPCSRTTRAGQSSGQHLRTCETHSATRSAPARSTRRLAGGRAPVTSRTWRERSWTWPAPKRASASAASSSCRHPSSGMRASALPVTHGSSNLVARR